VARPLPQPQPQPRLQSQPQSQPQPEADARARADAQHAKAKHAQTEFRRLQHHFAKLQQHGRVKSPGRARLLRLDRALLLAQGSSTLSGRGIERPVTASQPAPSKPLIQISFGPPGSRSSRRYKLNWLRLRCNRRQSSCYSRPARL
jgi:hypothetical protein